MDDPGAPSVRLFGFPSLSRGIRVAWLMEELGDVRYTLVMADTTLNSMSQAEAQVQKWNMGPGDASQPLIASGLPVAFANKLPNRPMPM